MRHHLALLLAAGLAAVLLPVTAGADRITLANGHVVEGQVLSESREGVRVRTAGGVLTLDPSSIVEIERVEDFENTLMNAETAFRRRRALDAFALLDEARIQGAPRELIREVIEKHNGGIQGTIHAMEREEDKLAMRRVLRRAMYEDLLTPRALFHASQNFFLLDDWTSAAEAIERMPEDEISGDPVLRSWVLDFLRKHVRRQLASGNFEAALSEVERMRRLTGEGPGTQVPLVLLSHVAAARERHEFGRAFEVLAEELFIEVPEIARNRTVYTIEALRQWAEDTGRYREARVSLRPIRDVFFMEYMAARNDLLAAEAEYLLARAQPAEAFELLSEVPEGERSAELKEIALRAEHGKRMEELRGGDPLERLRHGRWAAEQGLHDEALQLFEEARANPNLRDISDQLIENTRRKRDTALLDKAQRAYDMGHLHDVMSHTHRILANPEVGSALSEEAERLKDLARRSMRREAEERPYMAEVFFQQAERAHFLQRNEEAFNLLNMILERYADTPAASRAADLYPSVVRSLEISYLEGRIAEIPAHRPRLEALQEMDQLGDEVSELLEALQSQTY